MSEVFLSDSKRFCSAEIDLSGAITESAKRLVPIEGNRVSELLDILIEYTASDSGAVFDPTAKKFVFVRGVRQLTDIKPEFLSAINFLNHQNPLVYGGGSSPGQALLLFPRSRSGLLLSVMIKPSLSALFLLNSCHDGWYTPVLIKFTESVREIAESLINSSKGR